MTRDYQPCYAPVYPSQTSFKDWDFGMIRTHDSSCGRGKANAMGLGSLPAGSYLGRVGRRIPTATSQAGAAVRDAFAQHAVLSGLGSAHGGGLGVCTDVGATVALTAADVVSNIFGAVAASSGDQGLTRAGRVVSALNTGAAQVANSYCDAQQRQSAPQVSYDTLTSRTVDQVKADLAAANRAERATSTITVPAQAVAVAPPPAPATGFTLDTKTLAIAGVGVLALVLLLRR